jgi:hypothetical protein
MKAFLYTVLAALLLLPCAALGQHGSVTNLRVYAVGPRLFPYKFMSSMGSGTDVRLVFNHRSGSTHIVRIGESLGDYRVRSYVAGEERVFNPTINAEQTRRSGKVVLLSRDDDRVTLDMGRPLPVQGWTACLVDLSSGLWDYVREGDELPGEPPLPVSLVGTNRVCVRRDGLDQQIAWASGKERAELTDLWAARKRAHLAALEARRHEADAEEAARQARPVRVPHPGRPPAVAPSRSPGFVFGTDYAYPTEFDVISVTSRDADGNLVNVPLVVPTRFERRTTGVLLRGGGR